MKRYFIGMNKWGHDASACLLTLSPDGSVEFGIYLKERMTRAKRSAGTLEPVLIPLRKKIAPKRSVFAENSSIQRPSVLEERLSRRYPGYFDQLLELGLNSFYRYFNEDLRFVSHHRCHALAATAISPFRKSIILVMDGAGNYRRDFDAGDPENFIDGTTQGRTRVDREWCSVYLQDGADIRCVRKNWRSSLGHFFENASRYVFNSPMEAGKVMGLAPYGKAAKIVSAESYMKALDRKKAFRRKGKQAWENSPNFSHYARVAATVQKHFETKLLDLVRTLRKEFPDYHNLILTGGCALNCVANMKVCGSGVFERVFVPPFPGDESVSLGAAVDRLFETPGFSWTPVPWKKQSGSFGPLESVPSSLKIKKCFSDYRIHFTDRIDELASEALASGKIIGRFQGRSESGPRALGHRSILAAPFSTGMRDDLNERIKKRESFRPYGGVCLWEKAHEYFEVPKDFESPFMSFAPKVRRRFAGSLAAIRHVDGTSRIQTVRKEADPELYRLILAFGRKTGIHCLLNTSMNVMGEPIVETVEDTLRFFQKTPVDALAIGNAWILRE